MYRKIYLSINSISIKVQRENYIYIICSYFYLSSQLCVGGSKAPDTNGKIENATRDVGFS